MITDQGSRRRHSVLIGLTKTVNALVGIVLLAGGAFFLHCRFHTTSTPVAEYVALGSSFAAGPGDGQRSPESLDLCEQSDGNYPHLLARRYGLSLKDVTCSGATTGDVLEGGQWFQAAQVNAVQPGTKLVTVTVGGNDISYIGSLTAWACTNDPATVPRLVRALGMCRMPDQGKVEQALRELPGQLREIATEIHRRAPAAHILFIDYTTVLPDAGTCARLPLKGWQADRGRYLADRLREETTQIALETHSKLLRASEITHGHDVCSSDPWVYGFQFPPSPFAFGPVPFHPTKKAMQAVANAAGDKLALP
jgi:lysophospholipase L1-like esterase